MCRLTFSKTPFVVYVAGCVDYPPEYVAQHDSSALLGAALQGEINDSHGKMLEAKDLTIGSVPGREATIDIGNGVIVERVFIEGRRIFHFGVGASPEVAKRLAADLFDSIELHPFLP